MLNSKVKQVCKYHFQDLFRTSLWFLGIYVVSLTLLYTSMAVFADGEDNITILDTFGLAAFIFIFVMGIIIYSLSLKEFIYQGVTRKDFFKGILLSTFMISLFFSIIIVIIDIVWNIVYGNDFIISSCFIILLSSLVFIFSGYMTGILIGATFSGYGVIRGLLSIVVSVVAFNFLISLYFEIFGLYTLSESLYPVSSSGGYLSLLYMALITVVITLLNYLLNRNINIKISMTAE